jgi:catechol 2,3-dioxygenase-like lactoylglutathione lyase family enzyme
MEKGWTFTHVGMTVKDLEKTVKLYQSLGAEIADGPLVLDFNIKEWKVYGKNPAVLKTKLCVLKMNGLMIEMFEPLDGNSTWKDHLKKYGEGIDHIGFHVDDTKAEAAKMASKGHNMVVAVTPAGEDLQTAYFDTGAVGGILVELSRFQMK